MLKKLPGARGPRCVEGWLQIGHEEPKPHGALEDQLCHQPAELGTLGLPHGGLSPKARALSLLRTSWSQILPITSSVPSLSSILLRIKDRVLPEIHKTPHALPRSPPCPHPFSCPPSLCYTGLLSDAPTGQVCFCLRAFALAVPPPGLLMWLLRQTPSDPVSPSARSP